MNEPAVTQPTRRRGRIDTSALRGRREPRPTGEDSPAAGVGSTSAGGASATDRGSQAAEGSLDESADAQTRIADSSGTAQAQGRGQNAERRDGRQEEEADGQQSAGDTQLVLQPGERLRVRAQRGSASLPRTQPMVIPEEVAVYLRWAQQQGGPLLSRTSYQLFASQASNLRELANAVSQVGVDPSDVLRVLVEIALQAIDAGQVPLTDFYDRVHQQVQLLMEADPTRHKRGYPLRQLNPPPVTLVVPPPRKRRR